MMRITAPPLVDIRVMRGLEAHVGAGAVADFAASFAGLWGQRFHRISAAADAGDAEGGMDALLSLRAASQMIGAAELASRAADLEDLLSGNSVPAARESLCRLRHCGDQTLARLRDLAGGRQ
ncbi:hypothetical protein KIH31_09400 [Paenarthrobacter sp. DKR-5]|uniref:hypothetical protein n=1 Tax=Paenarthrobacter sp. DKR-5 TaxID=2835535 RepID=UPI001BDD4C52|nr:hypothetical protein [Paenarthrobacter sp. DKR-5]MBT1002820.1 hypothetical protein [Paenarthrobacter sp. DKR-5]